MFCTIGEKKQIIDFKGSVSDLLGLLNISDQIVIVKKNGSIVTELEHVSDNDTVEIQQVVFGG